MLMFGDSWGRYLNALDTWDGIVIASALFLKDGGDECNAVALEHNGSQVEGVITLGGGDDDCGDDENTVVAFS